MPNCKPETWDNERLSHILQTAEDDIAEQSAGVQEWMQYTQNRILGCVQETEMLRVQLGNIQAWGETVNIRAIRVRKQRDALRELWNLPVNEVAPKLMEIGLSIPGTRSEMAAAVPAVRE